MVRSDHLLNCYFLDVPNTIIFQRTTPNTSPLLPNHVRELIELLKPKKVCVQQVYNTSD